MYSGICRCRLSVVFSLLAFASLCHAASFYCIYNPWNQSKLLYQRCNVQEKGRGVGQKGGRVRPRASFHASRVAIRQQRKDGKEGPRDHRVALGIWPAMAHGRRYAFKRTRRVCPS